MFYSYDFYTGPPTVKRFEPRFTSGAGVNPITKETEYWVGMSLNSKFDGEGMKKYGRPHLNLVVGMYMHTYVRICVHCILLDFGKCEGFQSVTPYRHTPCRCLQSNQQDDCWNFAPYLVL